MATFIAEHFIEIIFGLFQRVYWITLTSYRLISKNPMQGTRGGKSGIFKFIYPTDQINPQMLHVHLQ